MKRLKQQSSSTNSIPLHTAAKLTNDDANCHNSTIEKDRTSGSSSYSNISGASGGSSSSNSSSSGSSNDEDGDTDFDKSSSSTNKKGEKNEASSNVPRDDKMDDVEGSAIDASEQVVYDEADSMKVEEEEEDAGGEDDDDDEKFKLISGETSMMVLGDFTDMIPRHVCDVTFMVQYYFVVDGSVRQMLSTSLALIDLKLSLSLLKLNIKPDLKKRNANIELNNRVAVALGLPVVPVVKAVPPVTVKAAPRPPLPPMARSKYRNDE